MAGAASLPVSRFLCSFLARRLLDLLTSLFLPKMLLFEPRPTLAESSVTVAPVKGGEVDEASCLVWDDVLDGTFRRESFFGAFSGTVGPDCVRFSLVDEAEGGPASDVCAADSEVAIDEGILSRKMSPINDQSQAPARRVWRCLAMRCVPCGEAEAEDATAGSCTAAGRSRCLAGVAALIRGSKWPRGGRRLSGVHVDGGVVYQCNCLPVV
jgi:hypothetical protein